MSASPRGYRRPHVVPITAPSFPTLPRPRLYKNIAYTFVALAVLIVIGVLWLSSVRAEVHIKVTQSAVKLDSSVDIAKVPQDGQLAGRVVQGVYEKIQEFRVADLQAAASTTNSQPLTMSGEPSAANSSTSSGSVLARGTVRIVNKYSRAQTLVRTTRLLTADQKLYRIDKTVNVPPGGEAVVPVYADTPGSEFVIGPSKFTIPGLFIDLQKYIYAVSDAPFLPTPATDIPGTRLKSKVVRAPKTLLAPLGPVVDAADIEAAEKMLTDAVLEQAKASLAAEVNDPHLGEAVYFVKLIDKKSNTSPGQSAESFLASVKLDVTAVYYPKADMLSLIHSKLKDKIPDGRELVPFDDGNVVSTLELADPKSETATIRASVDAKYRLTALSPSLDPSVIAGKSKDDAVTLLKAVEGVDDVTITLHPSWFGKIPALKDHIDVTVE